MTSGPLNKYYLKSIIAIDIIMNINKGTNILIKIL